MSASLDVGPSPHILAETATTRTVMRDVLIGLLPVVAAAVWIFGIAALVQIALAVAACCATEVLASALRGRKADLGDGSAAITGVILGLSLPWSAPPVVALVGGLVAIGIGKIAFGGLGHNLFNPAMVGRAFAMIAFSGVMGASAYTIADGGGILTQATPLTAARSDLPLPGFVDLLLGNHNGSLGESSVLACLLGGLWLCWRRVASWDIPLGLLATVALLAGIGQMAGPVTGVPAWSSGVLTHLGSGAVVFGAFFIATDPVTSPLSRRGRLLYGILLGLLVWILRVFSNYPEGLMFAILMGNALVPLINRWTIPAPVGGPTKAAP